MKSWLREFSRLILAGIVCWSMSGRVAAAGEPVKPETPAAPPPGKVERKGPLAGLPSAPGPHIEKIKAMGDNTWLELGSPTPDPKWGDGIGRSYSYRMAYVEDMRGAFLYGDGVHGGTTMRNGKKYYNDALFLYDINGHRWVCAYPGFEIGTYSSTVTVDKDGFEATKDGPLPIAAAVHGYGNLTYDPVNKMFMSMQDESGSGHYRSSMPERGTFREQNAAKLTGLAHASPWMFDTVEGHWTVKKTEMGSPKLAHSGHLHYVPSKQAIFWYACEVSRGVSYYDPAKNTWREIQVKTPRRFGSYDTISCYDTKRNRIYFPGASKTGPDGKVTHDLMAYDVATDAWMDLNPKGDAALTFDGGECSNVASVQYDSANDVALIFSFGRQPSFAERSVVAYSPDKNELTSATKKIDGDLRNGQHNCFYDPELNAHFIFTAGDSTPGGKMFVYRYKRAAEKQ